jgi:hypothetical protein
MISWDNMMYDVMRTMHPYNCEIFSVHSFRLIKNFQQNQLIGQNIALIYTCWYSDILGNIDWVGGIIESMDGVPNAME